MLNTALAVVKNGKIETIEHIALSEGQKVLVTLLPDDATFWQEVSQQTLKRIWDNKEDDVYAQLDVAKRREHVAQLKNSFQKMSRDMGPRKWTREDLHAR